LTTPRLAQRVSRIKPSPTLAVTSRARELKAQGKDVIGLGAGEPDFDTPDFIKEAAIQAIKAGATKYTAVDGTPGLKQAIVDKFSRENKLDYALNQILVSVGAKHSLYNLMQALLDSGDEVIIPAPHWVSYPDMALLADAKPVVIDAGIEAEFKISAEQLEAAITDRTRLVIINSPSNPTGGVYSRAQLQALGEVLRKHPHAYIVTDDIYEHILWTKEPFTNIVNVCPDLKDRTVVINGVSKAYSMTGWRIGYAAGPAAVIEAMKKIQSQSTSNPTSIAQAAAEAALKGGTDCITSMVVAFKKRHDHIISRLNRIRGVHCIPSQGTFYAFPDMRKAIEQLNDVTNDIELGEYLLNEAGVALVPGSAFGADGYMRLSYATSLDNLNNALDRIEKVFGKSDS
jgi:aspartate aminotransferase